ncbi:MAG: hypothetical protein KJZ86_18015 [Caldilineaceae bacterium]|nr:hypothetical protein [Caldilineaceae bacterium]
MNNAKFPLGRLQYAVIVLTLLTALLHLALGIGFFQDTLGKLFVLNGVGYLALLAALYFLPQFAGMRSTVRWVLMAFTALTIVAYFVMNDQALTSPPGLLDKAIEVALIVLLYRESQA